MSSDEERAIAEEERNCAECWNADFYRDPESPCETCGDEKENWIWDGGVW